MCLSMENALKVAQKDCYVGVCWAIELLEEMGFNCSYYWETMAQVDDVDEDDLNLKTRDELYKRLGIMETMKKAYSIIN